MKGKNNTTRNLITILMSVLIAQILARMVLGKNEVYQLGISFGASLHDRDDDLDPKELDFELQELGGQLGTAPVVGKLLGDDEFVEGLTFGYYEPEILE